MLNISFTYCGIDNLRVMLCAVILNKATFFGLILFIINVKNSNTMHRNHRTEFIKTRLVQFLLITFVLLFETVFAEPLSDDDLKTLQLVHIIFRHGNRTPIKDNRFQNDEHINETYYPFGLGELNIKGKENAYNFGMEVRERYIGFIPETYYPPDVKAYSTNVSRTQMTLQAVLSAIYPPVWPNVILPFLMWQPISYEIFPSKEDIYLSRTNICPEILNYVTNMDDNLKALYAYVEKHSGRELINSKDMMTVYNTILVEKENGFNVPAWAEEIFNNGSLQAAGLDHWKDLIEFNLPLMSGKLIEKITSDSEAKIKNNTESKLFFYSGHDSNIAMLLGVFDAFKHNEIEYLAHFFIELHKIDDIYGFKIYFQNGENNPLESVAFKECTDTFCTMDNFKASTKHLYEPEPKCN